MKNYILEYLKDNPTATNREIADDLGIPYDSVRAYISKYKKAELLDVNILDGRRYIDINLNKKYAKAKPKYVSSIKAELDGNLKKIANKIAETILLETRTESILEAGRLYVKIYDRLL